MKRLLYSLKLKNVIVRKKRRGNSTNSSHYKITFKKTRNSFEFTDRPNREAKRFNFKKGDTEGIINYALAIKDTILETFFSLNIPDSESTMPFF